MVSKCSVTLCSLDSRVKVITSTKKKMLRYDTMEVENSHKNECSRNTKNRNHAFIFIC
jgi:hypothetical protein